jgi:hypothetical protein
LLAERDNRISQLENQLETLGRIKIEGASGNNLPPNVIVQMPDNLTINQTQPSVQASENQLVGKPVIGVIHAAAPVQLKQPDLDLSILKSTLVKISKASKLEKAVLACLLEETGWVHRDILAIRIGKVAGSIYPANLSILFKNKLVIKQGQKINYSNNLEFYVSTILRDKLPVEVVKRGILEICKK